VRNKELIDLEKLNNFKISPSELSKQTKSEFEKFIKTTVGEEYKTNATELNNYSPIQEYTLQSLKAFSFWIDDSTKKTSEFSKSLKNFKDSISEWVLNKQITSIGTPESQLDAAKKSYESQLAILRNGTSSDLDKTSAMSKITGAADSYISKIEQMYAHGSVGSRLISGIVSEVSALPDVLSISELQLNTLNSIDDGIKQLVIGDATLESNAVNAGYSGDYTDIPAMHAFLSKPAANDPNTNSTETIAELKKQNEQLSEIVVQLQALVTTQTHSNAETQG
jgi:molecular chaperone GrpE (heat shock protein)